MSYKHIKGILLYVEKKGSEYNRKHGDKGELMQEIWISFSSVSLCKGNEEDNYIFSVFGCVCQMSRLGFLWLSFHISDRQDRDFMTEKFKTK